MSIDPNILKKGRNNRIVKKYLNKILQVMNEIQDYVVRYLKSIRIIKNEEIEELLDFEIKLAQVKTLFLLKHFIL